MVKIKILLMICKVIKVQVKGIKNGFLILIMATVFINNINITSIVTILNLFSSSTKILWLLWIIVCPNKNLIIVYTKGLISLYMINLI